MRKRTRSAEQIETEALLKYINGARVTSNDLVKVIEEAESRENAGKSKDGEGMFLIVMMFRKRPRKAQAIFFRMQALSRLLEDGAIPGYYAMPRNERGAIPIREALIKAAASQPLISVNHRVVFDRQLFVDCCLKMVEAEKTVQ